MSKTLDELERELFEARQAVRRERERLAQEEKVRTAPAKREAISWLDSHPDFSDESTEHNIRYEYKDTGFTVYVGDVYRGKITVTFYHEKWGDVDDLAPLRQFLEVYATLEDSIGKIPLVELDYGALYWSNE